MKRLLCTSAMLLASAVLPAAAIAQDSSARISITPPSAQKVIDGAPEHFTGSVRVQFLFDAREPAQASGAQVTFQPGARTAWHTHPLGQVLIVTDGTGWVQQWGEPVHTMHKGDVIYIPPGVKHWHGATPTTSVTHLALQEQRNGVVVNWLEKVTDQQYQIAK